MACILLVDDSKFGRGIVMKMLQKNGHDIIEADNGLNALKVLQESSPACIIADILMPEMDGQKLLVALHRLQRNIPVIILTADIQEKTKNICMELGASMVLHKPPKEKDLLSAIDEVIHKEKSA